MFHTSCSMAIYALKLAVRFQFAAHFFFLSKSKRPGKFLLRRIFRKRNLDLNVKGITEEAMTGDFTVSPLVPQTICS